jgi:hypothetical protein
MVARFCNAAKMEKRRDVAENQWDERDVVPTDVFHSFFCWFSERADGLRKGHTMLDASFTSLRERYGN